jgi:hypothetical protein
MHPARTSVITAMSTPSCVAGAPVPDSYRRGHPWQGVRDGLTTSTCPDSASRAAVRVCVCRRRRCCGGWPTPAGDTTPRALQPVLAVTSTPQCVFGSTLMEN